MSTGCKTIRYGKGSSFEESENRKTIKTRIKALRHEINYENGFLGAIVWCI
jgi:hypothetical protein